MPDAFTRWLGLLPPGTFPLAAAVILLAFVIVALVYRARSAATRKANKTTQQIDLTALTERLEAMTQAVEAYLQSDANLIDERVMARNLHALTGVLGQLDSSEAARFALPISIFQDRVRQIASRKGAKRTTTDSLVSELRQAQAEAMARIKMLTSG